MLDFLGPLSVIHRRRAAYNFFEILILDTARKQRIFLDTTDRGHLNLFFSFDRENCCGILEYLRYCTIRYNSFEVLECAFRIAEQISLHNCIRHIWERKNSREHNVAETRWIRNITTMADALTTSSRSFYERSKAKLGLSIVLGAASMMLLGFCSSSGGLVRGSHNSLYLIVWALNYVTWDSDFPMCEATATIASIFRITSSIYQWWWSYHYENKLFTLANDDLSTHESDWALLF